MWKNLLLLIVVTASVIAVPPKLTDGSSQKRKASGASETSESGIPSKKLQTGPQIKSGINISLSDLTFISSLGEGKRARAFEVEYRDNNYALKAYDTTALDNVDNILTEVNMLKRINEKSAQMNFYASWTEGSWFLILMKLAPGGNLRDALLGTNEKVIKNPALTEIQFVSNVIAGIVDGLWKLHQWGIVHGDVYFVNVVIDEHGFLTWIDFERSKLVSECHSDRDYSELGQRIIGFFENVPEDTKARIFGALQQSTDSNLGTVFKNDKFFTENNVNWKEVAEKKSVPPFSIVKPKFPKSYAEVGQGNLKEGLKVLLSDFEYMAPADQWPTKA